MSAVLLLCIYTPCARAIAGDASIAHALKASIPKGHFAPNTAMCEPMPALLPFHASLQVNRSSAVQLLCIYTPCAAAIAGDASIAHALKASIPKGPLAENAAMCEPMPDDPPGNISEQELAAMREGRQGNTAGVTPASSETAPDASRWLEAATAATEGEGQQPAGGSGSAAMQGGGVEAGRGGSNAPGDDPGHIKQVVQEETLHGQE
jgi:hypothetical protein